MNINEFSPTQQKALYKTLEQLTQSGLTDSQAYSAILLTLKNFDVKVIRYDGAGNSI